MPNPHSSDHDLEVIREKCRRRMAQAQDVQVEGRSDLTVRDEANALVMNALRANDFFEHLHSGGSSPLLRDPTLSRITDEEMKKLMIEVSARLAYLLALKAHDPGAYFAEIDRNLTYAERWERHAITADLPAAPNSDVSGCASCGTALYNPLWRFCPLCGVPTPKTRG